MLDRNYAMFGQLGTMCLASCGSSTYEGASDVSLFHTRLTFPLALAAGCVCCGFLVFVCVFPGFASAWGVFLVYTSRVLDDRQCFTARSARRKKKVIFDDCMDIF